MRFSSRVMHNLSYLKGWTRSITLWPWVLVLSFVVFKNSRLDPATPSTLQRQLSSLGTTNFWVSSQRRLGRHHSYGIDGWTCAYKCCVEVARLEGLKSISLYYNLQLLSYGTIIQYHIIISIYALDKRTIGISVIAKNDRFQHNDIISPNSASTRGTPWPIPKASLEKQLFERFNTQMFAKLYLT